MILVGISIGLFIGFMVGFIFCAMVIKNKEVELYTESHRLGWIEGWSKGALFRQGINNNISTIEAESEYKKSLGDESE